MKKEKLLLMEDVYGLGKKGQIVQAKPGYFRNFLWPKKKAIIADANTLRMQEKLQKEREEKAKEDRKLSQGIAEKLTQIDFAISVKTDPEGKMYGSVSATDIVALLSEKDMPVERHCVKLGKPIKQVGSYRITLLLKEEVTAIVKLTISPEDAAIKEALEKRALEREEQQKAAEKASEEVETTSAEETSEDSEES